MKVGYVEKTGFKTKRKNLIENNGIFSNNPEENASTQLTTGLLLIAMAQILHKFVALKQRPDQA